MHYKPGQIRVMVQLVDILLSIQRCMSRLPEWEELKREQYYPEKCAQ